MTMKTMRTRPDIPSREARVRPWHQGRYYYRIAKDRPAVILGSDISSACFMAKVAIAKQADRAWRAYIKRKMSEVLV